MNAHHATLSSPANSRDADLEALIRSLALDFPLHSPGELRRTILDALDDLWPHKDPTSVLDRARERLQGF